MKWTPILVLMLIPGVQACSFEQEPPGPAEIAAVSFDGTRWAFDVEDRGLGADCSLEIASAIGDTEMAWVDGGELHRLDLATGDVSRTAFGLGRVDLAYADGTLFAWSHDTLYEVTDQARWVRMLHERPYVHDGWIIEDNLGRLRAFDLRTGALVLDAEPQDTPYDADSLGPEATDGDYVVFEVFGQGRQTTISWHEATSTWRELDVPEWGWRTIIRDGVMIKVTNHHVYTVDLATGAVSEGTAPEGDILALSDGWVMTGSYSKPGATAGKPGGTEGIPAPLAWPALGLAIALARRGPRANR